MRQDSRAVIFLVLASFFAACSDSGDPDKSLECGPNKPCPANQTCNLETNMCVQSNNATVTLALHVAGMGTLTTVDGTTTNPPCTGASCSYSLPTNSNATITASPAAGWKLQGWSGDCTGTATGVSVKMDMNRTCTATFVTAPTGIPVTVTPTTGGTVSTNPALTCTGGTCSGSVASGTSITLTATPTTGFRFVSWAGSAACDGKTTSPLTVTVTGELMCTARFVQTLSVTVMSDVSAAPVTVTTDSCTGTSCPADKGSNATFAAGALTGYRFTGWTGDAVCVGNSATFTVKIAGPITCQAHYAKRLKVSGLVQSGLTGDVKADAPDSSSVCSGNSCTVDAGDAVNLVAPTVAAHRLTGWTGAGCEGGTVSGSGITITPSTTDVTCTAQYVLGVSVSGTVVGAVGQVVATSPTGTCSAGSCQIDAGGEVVLAAPTINSARFVDWEGSAAVCTGTTMSLDLKNVQSTVSCEAHYHQRITVGWSVPAGIDGAITATASDPHAQCNAARCIVDQGTTVMLSPPAQDGFRFLGWQGAGCETGTVTAGENTTCKATYAQEIVVTGNLLGATGTVAAVSTSPGNDCADNHCTLDAGGDVTLTAPDLTPDDRFTLWNGDDACTTGAGVRTLILTAVAQSTTCNANYIHRLKVSVATEAGVTDPVTLTLADPNATMMGSDWFIDTGTGVTITAPDESGKRFKSWTGTADCNGKTAQTLNFTPTGDVSCTATYQAQILVKAVGNPASAPVTVSGPGCAAGSTSCTVDSGASMSFSAGNLAGFRFTGWSGSTGCAGNANPLPLSPTAATTCTGNYVQQFVVMGTAGANGDVGVAAVAATCTGRSCVCAGNSCTVDMGATVRLTPAPDGGFDFNQWSGTGCTPVGSNPLDLTNVSASCAASFKPKTFAVNGVASPTAAGVVALTCPGGDCAHVPFNSQVTFNASANSGYVFKGWDATCAAGATNPQIPARTVMTITGNLTCTASYRIQVQGSIDAPSTIQGAASSGVCGPANQIVTCAVDPGSSVTFHANLATDVVFSSWSGCPGGVLSNIASPAVSCSANVYNLFAKVFGRDGGDTVARVFSPDGKSLTAATQTQVNGTTVGARTLDVNDSGDIDNPFTYSFNAVSVNGADFYAANGGTVILSTVAAPVAGVALNEPHLLILDGAGRRVSSKAYLLRTTQTGKSVIGGSDGNVRFMANGINNARVVTTDTTGARKLDFLYRTVDLGDCKTPRNTVGAALADAGGGDFYLVLSPSDTDFEIVRLKADGTAIWVAQIIGSVSLAPIAANVVSGNIVVTGLALESAQGTGADAFVVSLDRNGNPVFAAGIAGRIFGRLSEGTTARNEGFVGASAGRGGQLVVTGTVATAMTGGTTVPVGVQLGWIVLLGADGTLKNDMTYGVLGGINTLLGSLAPAGGGYLALGATFSTATSGSVPDVWGLRVADDLSITMNSQFPTLVQASGAAERGTLRSVIQDGGCVARGQTDGAQDPTDVSVDGPTTTDVTEHILAP